MCVRGVGGGGGRDKEIRIELRSRQQTRRYVHAPSDAEAAVITNEARRGTHVPLCVRDLISLPAACVVYLLAK